MTGLCTDPEFSMHDSITVSKATDKLKMAVDRHMMCRLPRRQHDNKGPLAKPQNFISPYSTKLQLKNPPKKKEKKTKAKNMNNLEKKMENEPAQFSFKCCCRNVDLLLLRESNLRLLSGRALCGRGVD